MNKTLKATAFVGGLTCIVGLAGIIPTLYYSSFSAKGTSTVHAFSESGGESSANTPVAPTAKPVVKGRPSSISIASVGINNLSVVDGVYDAQKQDWNVSLHNAHFALLSSEPNDTTGQTYIYGHYRPEVFARLHTIKPGAEATIVTDNGYRFVYEFQRTIAVSPEDTQILDYQGPPVLTIQTCSGSWMQNRQLFRFTFSRVEKI